MQSGVCIVFLLLLGSFNAGIVETLDNQQRSWSLEVAMAPAPKQRILPIVIGVALFIILGTYYFDYEYAVKELK